MNAKHRVKESEFAEHLRHRLETDQEPLAPDVARRLRSGRETALARIAKPEPLLRFWKPLASCATAAALVMTVAYIDMSSAPVNGNDELAAEAELLFSEEDLQFYEELEFYTWLADNEL